jgi:hypothetical protein
VAVVRIHHVGLQAAVDDAVAFAPQLRRCPPQEEG